MSVATLPAVPPESWVDELGSKDPETRRHGAGIGQAACKAWVNSSMSCGKFTKIGRKGRCPHTWCELRAGCTMQLPANERVGRDIESRRALRECLTKAASDKAKTLVKKKDCPCPRVCPHARRTTITVHAADFTSLGGWAGLYIYLYVDLECYRTPKADLPGGGAMYAVPPPFNYPSGPLVEPGSFEGDTPSGFASPDNLLAGLPSSVSQLEAGLALREAEPLGSSVFDD